MTGRFNHVTFLPLLLGSEDAMQRPVVCAPPLSGAAFRVEDVNADWHRVVSNIVKQRCTRTRVSYESLLLESRLGRQQLPWSTHTHMHAIALMIDGWFGLKHLVTWFSDYKCWVSFCCC